MILGPTWGKSWVITVPFSRSCISATHSLSNWNRSLCTTIIDYIYTHTHTCKASVGALCWSFTRLTTHKLSGACGNTFLLTNCERGLWLQSKQVASLINDFQASMIVLQIHKRSKGTFCFSSTCCIWEYFVDGKDFVPYQLHSGTIRSLCDTIKPLQHIKTCVWRWFQLTIPGSN